MAGPLSAGPLPPVDGGTEGGRRQRDDEAISTKVKGWLHRPTSGLPAMTWFGDIFTMIWSYLSRPRRFQHPPDSQAELCS